MSEGKRMTRMYEGKTCLQATTEQVYMKVAYSLHIYIYVYRRPPLSGNIEE